MYESEIYSHVLGKICDERQLTFDNMYLIDGYRLERHSSFTVEYLTSNGDNTLPFTHTFTGVKNLYSFTATQNFARTTAYNIGQILNGYRYLGYLYGIDDEATLYWTYVGF